MSRALGARAAAVVVVFLGVGHGRVGLAQPVAASDPTGVVLRRYCVGCHNERLKTAGLALDTLNPSQVAGHEATWEKVVRKLRTGAMPPAGRPRPTAAEYDLVAGSLETALDARAAATPNPGRVADHRLNRTEYGNAIRDLLALEIDPAAFLPADDADMGFDNMADILSVSPALLERSMFAARQISRMAVGDTTMTAATNTYVSPKMLFQDDRMDEALPFGSRGGMAVRHYFPLDAEYELRIVLRRQLYDYIRGLVRPQQLEVRVDGERVKVFTIGGAPGTPPPATFAGANFGDREWEDYTLHADEGLIVRFKAAAGPRTVGVSFAQARSVRDGVLQPRAGGKVLAVAERWRLAVRSARSLRRTRCHLGALRADRAGTDAKPREDLRLPADAHGRRGAVREADPLDDCTPRVQAAAHGGGRHLAADVLSRRPQGRKLRAWYPARHREHPRRSRVPVPCRARGGRRYRRSFEAQRSRAGVAVVLLPVEQHSRRRAAGPGGEGAAQRSSGA